MHQINERCRGAIQDGNFFAFNLDYQIIDAESGSCREYVFDSADRGMAVGKSSSEIRALEIFLSRWNFNTVEVHSTEKDTAVWWGRAHAHGNAHAAVQANPCTIYVFPERFLRPVQSNPPQSWAYPAAPDIRTRLPTNMQGIW